MKRRAAKRNDGPPNAATGALFVLHIRRVSASNARVGFRVVNTLARKPAKLADVRKHGFFVLAKDAWEVLSLIQTQVQRDNAKLCNSAQ